MTIVNFPNDIINEIFSYLSLKDLGNCAEVCKKWNEALFIRWQKIAEKIGCPIGPEVKGIHVYTFLSGMNKTLSSLPTNTLLKPLFSLNLPQGLKKEFQTHILFPYSTMEEIKTSKEYLDARSTILIWEKMAEAIGEKVPDLYECKTLDDISKKAKEFSTWCECKKNQEKLGGIYSLDLSNAGITALPLEMKLLINLEKLDLSRNHLTNIPSELGNLTRLVKLDLSWNHLTSISSELGNLTRLKDLDLGWNHLTSIPSELGNLTRLENLDLSCNHLTSIPPEGCFTYVGEVNLSYNNIKFLPLGIFNISSLKIDNNPLTTVPPQQIEHPNPQPLPLNNSQPIELPSAIGQVSPTEPLPYPSPPSLWTPGNLIKCAALVAFVAITYQFYLSTSNF